MLNKAQIKELLNNIKATAERCKWCDSPNSIQQQVEFCNGIVLVLYSCQEWLNEDDIVQLRHALKALRDATHGDFTHSEIEARCETLWICCDNLIQIKL